MDNHPHEALDRLMQAPAPHKHARTHEEAMAAIDRAQAIAREVIPRDRSLVDEWMAEKRAEWARE